MKPLDCDAIELVDLYDLVLGTDDTRRAAPETLDEIRAHAESCPRCRLRLLDVTRISRSVSIAFEDRSIPIEESFEEALRARIAVEDEASRGERSGDARRRKSTTRRRARHRTPLRQEIVEGIVPADPERVREVLGTSAPRGPIRTGISGGPFDPTRPIFWLPLAAAILVIVAGGGWAIQYLRNYEPERKAPTAGGEPAPPVSAPLGADPAGPGEEPVVEPPRDVVSDPGPGLEPPPVVGPGEAGHPGEKPEPPAEEPPPRAIVEREGPPPGEPRRDPDPAGETLAAVLVHVRSLKGELGTTRAGKDEVRPFMKGVPLSPEEALVLSADGVADLEVVGGGSLVVGGGAVLRIARADDVHRVELVRGRVLFTARANERSFEVKTPHGSVRHVSTRFEVEVREAATRVTTLEGEAVLASAGGEVSVPAGSSSRAAIGRAPEAPVAVDLQEATAWVEGLADRRVVEFEDIFEAPRSGRIDGDAFETRSAGSWALPLAWTEDDAAARKSARFDASSIGGRPRDLIRIEPAGSEHAVVFTPRLSLVEGETYVVSFRIRAEADHTPLALVLTGEPPSGPAHVVRRQVSAGRDWVEVRLRTELPLALPPETRWWAGLEVEGALRVAWIGEAKVERLDLPRRREVDHDFHREQPAGWQRVTGAWQIHGGRLQARSSGQLPALLVLPPSAAYLGDYAAGMTASSEAGDTAGIAFRVADLRNHYRFLCTFGEEEWVYRLEAVEDGKVRLLAEEKAPGSPLGHVHLAVRALERSFEALVDGKVVLRADDGAFRRGAIGLLAVGEARFARAYLEDYR